MSAVIANRVQALSAAQADGSADKIAQAVDDLCRAIEDGLPPGLPADFVRSIGSALDGVPGSCHPDLRVEALVQVAHYQYNSDSFEPVDTVEKAANLARRYGHRAALRRALTAVAIVSADIGDLSRAMECYAEALDLANEDGDVSGRLALCHNTGIALSYAGQFHDAIASYEYVIGATDESHHLYYTAHASLARCFLSLGEIERGLNAAQTALRIPDALLEKDVAMRVLRETVYARLLVEAGNLELAGQYIGRARRHVAAAGSLRGQHMADLAEGLYLVRAGQHERGIALLTAALARARSCMPVMLRDTLRALAKAYDVSGLPQQAIGHLQELIEVARRWQCDVAVQNLRHRFPALNQENLGNAAFAALLRGEEAALRGKVSRQELFHSPMEMLERMAVTAELRDDSTGDHCYRVGKLSALLAQQLGWERREAQRLEHAARLHDIGKIGVPDEIILKRGRLTEAEREVAAAHTRVGADLLVKSNIPDITMAAGIALHHHDWWDGTHGEGAKADAIPAAARIVALAEVFDALTHVRAHRSAWSMREALGEISRLKGTQFEPRLADAFIALVRGIARDHPDIDVFLGEAAKSSTFLRARSRIREALDESSRQPA